MPKTKICTYCKIPKPIINFPEKSGRPGQNKIRRSRCRECINKLARKRYKQKSHAKNTTRQLPTGFKRCSVCKNVKPLNKFHPECKNPTRNWHYHSSCKSCSASRAKDRRNKGYKRPSSQKIEHVLIESKRKRVKNGLYKHGSKLLPFEIGIADIRNVINDTCPITGVKMSNNKGDPLYYSIDRVYNYEGYTPNNIRIVPLIYNIGRDHWNDIQTIAAINGINTDNHHCNDWSEFIIRMITRRKENTHNGIYTNPGSKKRHKFNITADDILSLIDKQSKSGYLKCAITNTSLSSNPLNPLYPSLDRIDCSKGYTINNLRIISRFINIARNKWDDKKCLYAINEMEKSIQYKDLYRTNKLMLFEDEFAKHKVFNNILLNRMGYHRPKLKLRPQSCDIDIIDYKTISAFLDKYHYIGPCVGKYYIGISYNNELIAVMVIRKPSRQRSGDWEIARMAGKWDITIYGLWSYVMKWITNNNLLSGKVISFSDNRLFDGKVYKQMGFKLDKKTKKDYYWMKNGIRHHKSALRKHGKQTESELRIGEGYRKVWDIGKKKWACYI